MNIKPSPKIPEQLLAALGRNTVRSYTVINTVFQASIAGCGRWYGVVGDGDNGSYEYFIWSPESGMEVISDSGYGSSEAALCAALTILIS